MSLTNADVDAVLQDPLQVAMNSGRPVVLYVSNNVPVELIHACGCFPLQLPTAPRADYGRADRYLEPNFDPMVRAALEQLLAGELDKASLLVLPRTIDAWQRLYYYLCELQRSFGESVPEPFLYDLQQLPTEASADYNAVSTELLAKRLQALGGVTLTDDALTGAIEHYNRIRAQLRGLIGRRWKQPSKLRGADALDLYTAAGRLDADRLERALDSLLAMRGEAAPGRRVLLVGSPHDSAAVHRAIERAGGQVVADFHARGDWSLAPDLALESSLDPPASGAPLRAISRHYHERTLSTRSMALTASALTELARASAAEVAIFFYYAEEEALTWDFPAQSQALAAGGVPSLLLPQQAYPPTADLEARVKEFLQHVFGDQP